MKLNERFKFFRSRFSLSSHQMAEKLEVSVDDYAKLELGVLQPSKEIYKKLLDAFPDVQLEDFFQVFELDSEPIEHIVRSELNKISAHYYSLNSELEKVVLFSLWLKAEMQVDNDSEFKAYIPLIKKMKNVDPDLLSQILDENNSFAHDPIRLLLRGSKT